MNHLQLETFLNDITYHSSYRFLEMGKDDDELMEVAKAKNIVLPALDLAVFKCIYAFTDRQNLNGCTLPKDEVEASLPTLSGKAIDFDHIRGKIVGHWADAKLEDDKIIAYGFFFKGNLPDEYEAIKELMEGGVLAISFEAYGVRNYTNEAKTEYTFSNIEFSGGALLINTTPAFPGSEVLEMAKTDTQKKVLEFASKTVAPKTFIKEKDEGDESMTKKQEIARFYTYDFETILSLVYSTEEELETYLNIESIDFKNMKVSAKRMDTEELVEISLKPKVKTLKQGSRNKEEIKMAEDKKKELAEETKAEETQVEETKAEETKAEETKAEAKVDEKREAEVAELKSNLEAKEAEIAKLTQEVEDLKASIETKVEEAKATTEKLIERRTALGDLAKDMTDEQLLDDKEFKIAMLEKENKELKSGKVEKASLEVGGTEKKQISSVFKIQESIHAKAFGGPLTEDE